MRDGLGRCAAIVCILTGTVLASGRELDAQRPRTQRDSLYRLLRAEAARSAFPGLVFLESARALLAKGDLDGVEPYFYGAFYDDSTSVAAYRRDLEPLWNQNEAETFTHQHGAARVEWLREFWLSRERPMHLPGERLAEHYRRLAYARAHFPRVGGLRTYAWWEKTRTGSWDFDDRGLIYVRHGPPLDVERGVATKIERPAVEMWWYGGDPELVFYFRSCAIYDSPARFARPHCPPPPDYRLVESPLDLFAPDPLLALARGDLGIDGVTARAFYLHDLLRGAPGEPGGAYVARILSVLRNGRDAMERGLATETYGFAFPTTLDATAEVVSLGARRDTVRAQVAFAVRAGDLLFERLEHGPDSGSVVYALRLRIELKGNHGRRVAEQIVDRAYAFGAPLAREAYLMGLETVPIAAPVNTGSVVIQQGVDRGVSLRLSDIDTPILEKARPDVSPLVIGRREAGLGYPVAGDTVFFNPSHAVTNVEPLEVSWEVYGAPDGVPLHVDLRIAERRSSLSRALGGNAPQLRFGFEDLPNGPVHLVRRTIDIRHLRPARYRVTVTVTFPSGVERRREADVEIVER